MEVPLTEVFASDASVGTVVSEMSRVKELRDLTDSKFLKGNDCSESAEYSVAMQELPFLCGRIQETRIPTGLDSFESESSVD